MTNFSRKNEQAGMKGEREGQGRPRAKALEVASGPVFSSERFTHSQALGLLALVNRHLRSHAKLEVSQGQGRLCQASSPALLRHTGPKGGPERKGFNSLIDLREVEG